MFRSQHVYIAPSIPCNLNSKFNDPALETDSKFLQGKQLHATKAFHEISYLKRFKRHFKTSRDNFLSRCSVDVNIALVSAGTMHVRRS